MLHGGGNVVNNTCDRMVIGMVDSKDKAQRPKVERWYKGAMITNIQYESA